MSDSDRIERDFYPDGKIENETTYLSSPGRRWVVRHWYPNGHLAWEIPVNDGVPDGTVTFWNDKGEIAGTYEMHDGTGVQKGWHSDGSLLGEITWLNGTWTGRQRVYFQGGGFVGESYWIKGRQVSKRKYFEACKSDPALPRYDSGDILKPALRRTRRKAVAHPIPAEEDPAVGEWLADPQTKEALQWLKEGPTLDRTLGELPTREASVKLVEKLYALGALKVWAVRIESSDPAEGNTGKLLIGLPMEKQSRQKLFRWAAKEARRHGFDPETDTGQQHLFVMLD